MCICKHFAYNHKEDKSCENCDCKIFTKRKMGKKHKGRKAKGTRYENALIKKAYDEGGFGMRKYASLGIIDCMWVDKDGKVWLVQAKFRNGAKPYINQSEVERIQEFGKRWQNNSNVWVGYFLKQAYKPEIRVKLN